MGLLYIRKFEIEAVRVIHTKNMRAVVKVVLNLKLLKINIVAKIPNTIADDMV
jgi:hypothetical protein